jgi:SAM-dependent methyltransferase
MSETFQIPIEAAEAYEQRFVPAIFAEWAPRAVAAAGVGPGTRLLDVACGTGIVARSAVDLIGDRGRVVGVDLNESMLVVARRIAPDIEWRRGDAEELPFEDESFDVAICQMAMMFFPDRRAAFDEMRRVLAVGGRLVVVVPAALDRQPAYRVFVDAAVEQAGPAAASLLGAYWSCGDLEELAAEAAATGLTIVDLATIDGTARFASAADFVATEIAASPLGERVDDAAAAEIAEATGRALDHYSSARGFEIPLVCHVLVAGRCRPEAVRWGRP